MQQKREALRDHTGPLPVAAEASNGHAAAVQSAAQVSNPPMAQKGLQGTSYD